MSQEEKKKEAPEDMAKSGERLSYKSEGLYKMNHYVYGKFLNRCHHASIYN